MAIQGTVFGRVAKDATTFNYGDGKVGVKFTIASNSRYSYNQDNPEATWVNVTMWRGGEGLARNILKGMQIGVVGEIEQLKDDSGANYNISLTGDELLFGRLPLNSAGNQGGGQYNGQNDPY